METINDNWDMAKQSEQKIEKLAHRSLSEGGEFKLDLERPEEYDAKSIVEVLRDTGFEAYFAGGYVRDKVLGVAPHDIDIATNATPDEIEKLFDKTIAVGKAFGVERVILDNNPKRIYEVATFRLEGPYSDKRRPDWVKFTSAEKDAQRRDFTINALFYDPIEQKIIDYVGGLEDLEKRRLRFVGKAQDRVDEDHLRIMRAVRFKNKYQLEMDAATEAAVKYNADLIKNVSAERIQEEFNKMMTDKLRAQTLVDLSEFGLLGKIMPELESMKGVSQPAEFHKEGDVWEHTIKSLKALPENASLEVSLAVIFHDLGKPQTWQEAPDRIRFSEHDSLGAEIAGKILRRLKYSNEVIDKVVWLVKNHMFFMNFREMRVAKQRRMMAYPESEIPDKKETWFPELLMVHQADMDGTVSSDKIEKVSNDNLRKIKKIWQEEQERPKEEKIPAIIDGKTIMKEFGLKPSKEVGRLKTLAQDAFLEGTVKSKEEAINFLKSQKV